MKPLNTLLREPIRRCGVLAILMYLSTFRLLRTLRLSFAHSLRLFGVLKIGILKVSIGRFLNCIIFFSKELLSLFIKMWLTTMGVRVSNVYNELILR
ncbi:MAG: hypothetical protein K0R08_1311, partial [Solimicrobium sp.]|nr:hypothetical protein [Solimicrobium sp.]